jgi:hypothetical protein
MKTVRGGVAAVLHSTQPSRSAVPITTWSGMRRASTPNRRAQDARLPVCTEFASASTSRVWRISLDHALLPRRGVGQDAPRLVLRRRLALRAQFRHRGDQQQHRRQQRDGHQQEEALDEIEGGMRHRVFLSEAKGQDPAVDHEISIRDARA